MCRNISRASRRSSFARPALRLLDLRPGGERARPLAFHLALFANAQALTKGSGGIPRFTIEFDRHAKLAHHLP
jgi:hypothetical protein